MIQVLLPIPWLRGLDDRLRVLFDWRDPAVWRVLRLMFPVTLGLGLINFNLVVDSIFASRLIDPELAPTAIDRAFRLYMLPQGMFSVAIATVLFPSLSRLAARGDEDGFRRTVSPRRPPDRVPALPGERGDSRPRDADHADRLPARRVRRRQTTVVAAALAAFSAGLFFNGTMLLLNRAFFGLQSNWIPTFVALGNLGVNAVFDAFFYRFGTWGIPLATSCANVVGTGALFFLLRRRLGRLELRETADSMWRILIASAAVAGASFGTWYLLDHALGRGFLGQLVSVGCALAVGTIVYLICLSCAPGARARGVASFATPRRKRVRWPRTASATFRSSPTSTMGSRRLPTASSS